MRKVQRKKLFRSIFVKTVLRGDALSSKGKSFWNMIFSEKEIIEEWLSKKRGAKVHFKIPVRGRKTQNGRDGKGKCSECIKNGS